MSYDLDYKDNKGNLFDLGEVMEEGGTYAVGNTKTTLNITYNYSWYYYMFLDKENGIRWLHGKKGKNCINKLKKAIKPFKNEKPYGDYWAQTPGNCVKPLKILLNWCEKFPEGVFDGD